MLKIKDFLRKKFCCKNEKKPILESVDSEADTIISKISEFNKGEALLEHKKLNKFTEKQKKIKEKLFNSYKKRIIGARSQEELEDIITTARLDDEIDIDHFKELRDYAINEDLTKKVHELEKRENKAEIKKFFEESLNLFLNMKLKNINLMVKLMIILKIFVKN